MVALSMALHCTLGSGCEATVESIQSEAVSAGYSKQGELFSVDYMKELASKYSERAQVTSGQHLLQAKAVMEDFYTGSCAYLVPYDTDFDQHPGTGEAK